MIRNLKQQIKSQMERKYDISYLAECNQKAYTYEKWLKKQYVSRKEIYGSEAFRKLRNKVSVISWNELEFIHDFAREELGDIVVFVPEEKGLLKEAVDIITSVFLEKEEVQVVYGDEDEINHNETARMNPWFKPDYSPDTLLSYFYFGSVVAVRSEALKKVVLEQTWGIREKLYALTLQICLPLPRKLVFHCREMLYTSHCISYWGWEESYRKVKNNYQNLRAKMNAEGVSIIIPSKDNPKVLERCLRSVVKWTKDIEYEIIVVDNGSNDENKRVIEEMQKEIGFQYIYHPVVFNFSFMCNLGAEKSSKDLLLFLNDDCEVKQSDWLKRLAAQAVVCDTGAVGAKLHYPDSKIIQHCGIYALYVGPAHKLQFKEDIRTYYDRRNLDVRNVLAVTGACLMMRRVVFEEVNGFEEKLQVAFNDVDLCYKIYKAGYNNVIDNEVQLWHHESLSRGSDDSPEKMKRHQQERDRLYQYHKELWGEDPYYHPGLTSQYLDINYSYAYEYEVEQSQINLEECVELEGLPKKIREDQCLVPMIEYAGDIRKWYLKEEDIQEITQRAKSENVVYFQGNMVVLGSNNSCYEKSILLRNMESGKFYQITPERRYRHDIFTNLPDQKHVALSGFAFLLNLAHLPKGNYEIGALAKDQISGQHLLRITALKLENMQNRKGMKFHDTDFGRNKL